MPEFSYIAKDRTGRTIEGTIQAQNSAIAAGRVREMGYAVEKVRALNQPERVRSTGLGKRFAENFVFPVVNGVPLKDLALFYRQFATMINAGIPLFQSLATLENQTRNPKLKGILRDCQAQVRAGGRLSDVFDAYPWVFNELQIEMLRAAEHGGMLDQMMNRIADYLEQEIALRRLISRLTLYPKITIFLALFILGKSFFTDALPAFSKLVIGSMGKMNYTGMDYLNDTLFFLCWIGLGAFAIMAFCRIVLFQSAAQESYERIKMSIPGLGTVARKFALAKFGHAFGAMYAGGLPLNTAIQVAGNASGSKVVGRATTRAIYAMERGTTLSQAFRETGAFPPIVLDMLHTGEQTGNVDAMMSKVAEYLEGDAEQKAHAYSHIFAATVGLIVAMFIGYAIIKFYTQLGSNTAEYLKDNPNILPGLK